MDQSVSPLRSSSLPPPVVVRVRSHPDPWDPLTLCVCYVSTPLVSDPKTPTTPYEDSNTVPRPGPGCPLERSSEVLRAPGPEV